MSELYQYTFDPARKTYSFITRSEIKVTVAISRDRRWFSDNTEIKEVYSFDIVTDKPSLSIDIKIRNTIIKILSDRLADVSAVIVYFCDPFDGKGAKRSLKFDRWFSCLENKSIEKHNRQVFAIDEEIDEEGNTEKVETLLYTSMLLHNENPLYKTLIRVFYSGDDNVTDKL
ncbi:DUF6169 family protein [Dyadobacter chenwenxiniae]|uniref:DUF6169 family protein n=1 Tax=Dyadobacter chenwenxiniae TaxID=2906456 RepID=A0A9X1TCW2_9BACT|nr:DUF6169 family protein [Dyadobacter chenwenxiniae]MCF0060114.1 DUF6169 family protein [Dyadobacter chenwenxiniae]UON85852.1 DUF6169 family protein [Dyadobacter chenwenxiniae]